MNWFKIKVNDGTDDGYQFAGCSEDSIEALVKKVVNGEYIRLDKMLYQESGKIKEWEQWDASLIPTAFINPSTIVDIMQYKGDPRTTPR